VKHKGSPKQVNPPNFWSRYESQVSDELKNMIEEQYVSFDLYIYCDCSVNVELRQMSCACSYVGNRRVIVKQQYVYPPPDCIDKPIYGEFKALIFGLTHFDKYMMNSCKSVIFYSDINTIEGFLHNSITFKRNASLKKLQTELIILYQKIKNKYPDLTIHIKYLLKEEKVYNPFHRASHNAANRMLNKKVKI
jgi:hypothetical protein